MRKTVGLFIAGTILLLAGCIKDISGEIPDNDPKITVNGFFNPRFPVLVSITQSASVLDTLGNKYLTGAKGYLYENNVLVDSLTYYPQYQYHIATGLFVPQSGNTYRLDVQADGLPSVSAQSALPDTTHIASIVKDTLYYAATGHDTYWLRIRFQDPAAAGDEYHLMVYMNRRHHDNTWTLSQLCFESDDPSFEVISKEFCSGGMFTDNSFNGQEKEILINTRRRTNAHLNDSLQFIVELRHASDPYYAYNKSLALYKNTQNDIFSQPGPILGNVIDGYGIFGGYAPVTDTVKLH